jgi:transcriptional regulator of acetoin/glycerol metabolism
MKGLTAWEWPGNIRELENFIERAVIVTRGRSLEAPLGELHKLETDEPATATRNTAQEDVSRIVKETVDALNRNGIGRNERARKQREELVRVLTETRGRVGGANGAAARMGMNRTTLYARLKKFGIDPQQYS